MQTVIGYGAVLIAMVMAGFTILFTFIPNLRNEVPVLLVVWILAANLLFNAGTWVLCR